MTENQLKTFYTTDVAIPWGGKYVRNSSTMQVSNTCLRCLTQLSDWHPGWVYTVSSLLRTDAKYKPTLLQHGKMHQVKIQENEEIPTFTVN